MMSYRYEQWCLPKDSKVIHHAKHDIEYCQCLEFIWFDDDYVDQAYQIAYMADMKSEKNKNAHAGELFQFEKGSDVLFFCLTHKLNAAEVDLNEIYEKALFGAIKINEQAETVQGFDFRYIQHELLDGILKALDCVVYEDFIIAATDVKWKTIYANRYYDAESAWGMFLAWKKFLKQAQLNACDVICITS